MQPVSIFLENNRRAEYYQGMLLKAGDWIDVSEAAALLGVSERRVQIFIAEERFPVVKIGRIYLMLRPDVEKFGRQPRARGRPPKKAE